MLAGSVGSVVQCLAEMFVVVVVHAGEWSAVSVSVLVDDGGWWWLKW